MTDEEKEKYRGGLIATCKTYCHIDYDDDIEILELMLDTTLDEMTELIPNFDRNNLTSRQKLLAFMSVKELYDNRDKYRSDTKTLSAAVSSIPMGAVKMKDTGATADVGWEKSDNSEHFYVKFINWGTIYQPPQEFIYATGREADAELQKIAEQEYQSYLDNTLK